MKIVHTIEDVRKSVRQSRIEGKTIGLVPTMGALHAGHASLIEAAVAECDFVVVSIFVNPTQFGPGEDLDKYPCTLDTDAAFCENLGADLIFAPSADEMYPSEPLTWVEVEKLTDGLCGANRPEHFKGVTTVCAKLFNIVGADIAYFGQKDAQQTAIIRRMVCDLNLPLQICVYPIVREPNGLAMSSRNRYLSAEERGRALCLRKALTACREQIAAGQRDRNTLIDTMEAIIAQDQGRIDYVSIVDAETLEPLKTIAGKVLVALAVHIGDTRLIDNILIDLNNPPNIV
ncbi:MAG: pantoate--beta-alanine ligase [Planctomycetales bacterium 4572_13]|nr:MAG: pantoate--beta-alanine ligase [Planctomycetales bacterium 4572_13]